MCAWCSSNKTKKYFAHPVMEKQWEAKFQHDISVITESRGRCLRESVFTWVRELLLPVITSIPPSPDPSLVCQYVTQLITLDFSFHKFTGTLFFIRIFFASCFYRIFKHHDGGHLGRRLCLHLFVYLVWITENNFLHFEWSFFDIFNVL